MGYRYPEQNFRKLKGARAKWLGGLNPDQLLIQSAKATHEHNKLLKKKKHQRGKKRQFIEEKQFQTKVRGDAVDAEMVRRGIPKDDALMKRNAKDLLKYDIFDKRTRKRLTGWAKGK